MLKLKMTLWNLRRRKRARRFVNGCSGSTLSLCLFALLVYLFTPINTIHTIHTTDDVHDTDVSDNNNSLRSEGVRSPHTAHDIPYDKNRIKSAAAATTTTVVVRCTVTTPHSTSPSTAAGGILTISVLQPEQDTSALFLALVAEGFYDGTYTFRVISGFVVQWGVRQDGKKPGAAREVVVVEPQKGNNNNASTSTAESGVSPPSSLSNVRGTLAMVGRGRTGQVFLNTGDNKRLDKDTMSTPPFATLDDQSMALADQIYAGYKEGLGQIKALKAGTVPEHFPEMARIDICRIVPRSHV